MTWAHCSALLWTRRTVSASGALLLPIQQPACAYHELCFS